MSPPDSSRAASGELPARRVADADGRRYRLRLLDRMPQDDGRGAGRLPAHHARSLRRPAELVVLAEAAPVGGDVAGVADGDEQVVGRVAEGVDDLEGGGLLPLDAVGVDGVDEGDGMDVGDGQRQLQRDVEVAVDGDDAGAVRDGLRQLALRDAPLRHEDVDLQAAVGGEGGGGGAGVAGRGAHDGALSPSSTALATAMTMPRSLNEPVGLQDSSLK